MATINIPRVDVVLLDQQRKQLAGIDTKNLTIAQQEALEGILNMLNQWSDNNQEQITALMEVRKR